MRLVSALSIVVALSGTALFAQTRANSASTSPSGRYGAIGCLARQGTGTASRFTVVDRRGDAPTTYRVQGDAELLTKHVGHTVEVMGSLTPPAAGTGQYTLKVTSLVWVASTCTR